MADSSVHVTMTGDEAQLRASQRRAEEGENKLIERLRELSREVRRVSGDNEKLHSRMSQQPAINTAGVFRAIAAYDLLRNAAQGAMGVMQQITQIEQRGSQTTAAARGSLGELQQQAKSPEEYAGLLARAKRISQQAGIPLEEAGRLVFSMSSVGAEKEEKLFTELARGKFFGEQFGQTAEAGKAMMTNLKGAGGFESVFSQAIGGARQSPGTVSQLLIAASQGAAQAAQLGYRSEEVIAMTSLMASAAGRPEEGGTLMEALMTKLAMADADSKDRGKQVESHKKKIDEKQKQLDELEKKPIRAGKGMGAQLAAREAKKEELRGELEQEREKLSTAEAKQKRLTVTTKGRRLEDVIADIGERKLGEDELRELLGGRQEAIKAFRIFSENRGDYRSRLKDVEQARAENAIKTQAEFYKADPTQRAAAEKASAVAAGDIATQRAGMMADIYAAQIELSQSTNQRDLGTFGRILGTGGEWALRLSPYRWTAEQRVRRSREWYDANGGREQWGQGGVGGAVYAATDMADRMDKGETFTAAMLAEIQGLRADLTAGKGSTPQPATVGTSLRQEQEEELISEDADVYVEG